jgi:acetylornithine deacetylase/succinyl-diaminopimelate desuccinylase-like protein
LIEVIPFVNANKEKYIDELKDFLKIPSISTLPEYKDAINSAADFVAKKLKAAGISRINIFKTEGHPIVYGEWLGAPGKPTVLIYGHYDVQPVDPIELWNHPPFDPFIKDNKIYARGATDDKGQLYMHIKSVEAYFKTRGSLPLNVK